MKVPIIILNYNTPFDCRKCISFLEKQQGIDIEIVVVDNCSSEDDLENLRFLCEEEQCTLIENHENKGYNAGNNIGLRYAADKGYEYALIANPDMEFPDSSYISKLLEVMETKAEVAVCGSNILGLDGKRQSPRKFISYKEELLWFLQGIWKKLTKKPTILEAQNQYCDILMGSCILVRMSFIKKIGYFDEKVFLYCEEAILGKQVKSLGRKMYYNNEVTAVHAHVPSAKGSFVKRHDIYWKSRWYYLTKYAGYSRKELKLLSISKRIHYVFKRLQFILCGIK